MLFIDLLLVDLQGTVSKLRLFFFDIVEDNKKQECQKQYTLWRIRLAVETRKAGEDGEGVAYVGHTLINDHAWCRPRSVRECTPVLLNDSDVIENYIPN